jgi:SAM-dependent methyltransferase
MFDDATFISPWCFTWAGSSAWASWPSLRAIPLGLVPRNPPVAETHPTPSHSTSRIIPLPVRSESSKSMAWAWTPVRRDDPELMDAPGLPEAEVEDAYRVLRRVNKQLGNLRTIRLEFLRFLREPSTTGSKLTVLDVGSGSADLSRALLGIRPGLDLRVIALDRDAIAVASARRGDLEVVQGDALRIPFADRSIDLVMAVKFAHHFHGAGLDRLLGEMARVARDRVVILDIRRHWLAYWGFRAWSLVFTTNRLVRHDGPLSVLRGFTREELLEAVARLDQFDWTVRSYAGFQLALVGKRMKDA